MTPVQPLQAENRQLAILLVVATTFCFAAGDTLAKLIVQYIPAIEANFLRSVVVCILMVPYSLRRVGRGVFCSGQPGMQLLRGALVSISSISFLFGLHSLAIADAAAINFVWPVLITLFAIPFLGEKVGVRRISAAGVGFLGMLLIIRPGSDAFQWSAVFPLFSAVTWSLASVLTRRIAATDTSETTIVWSAVVALIISGALTPFIWVKPDLNIMALACVIGLISAVGHSMLIYAYERAQASTLAPFAYLQLVWVTLLGYVSFATIPDAWKFAGMALIAASGIYTAHREHVRRKEALAKS